MARERIRKQLDKPWRIALGYSPHQARANAAGPQDKGKRAKKKADRAKVRSQLKRGDWE